MSRNKIQALVPKEIFEKFGALAKKQGRSKSNLAKKYITEGIANDSFLEEPTKFKKDI